MLKAQIEKYINEHIASLDLGESVVLTHPTDLSHGNYTTSIAMQLASKQKINPMKLAEKITKAIPKSEFIDRVEIVKPGFINIFLSTENSIKCLIELSSKDFHLSSYFPKKNRTVIVEYSSPNIAKPFTIGHLRSTIIGDAVANMMETIGYTVKRDNHVGDWGTQFGKLILAVQKWGNLEEIESSPRPIKILVDLYVRFHTEAEKNPKLEDQARKCFKKLESGDTELRDLWSKCVEWSWKEFDFIYEKLEIKFTENNGRGYGESFFEEDLPAVLEELKKKKLLKSSEGAQIVEFPDEVYPPLMIAKSDGASLYATRDLATDIFRKKTYGDDVLIINEVGSEQTLYFRQLYELESMMGLFPKDQRVHVKHGLYRFKDQKMSTRKGNTIWLEDVIKEAEERASELGDDTSVSSTVAIASLKWNDLKHSPQQDVIFDWENVLNMQGNSGPDMLYAYVRTQGILKGATLNDVSGAEEKLEVEEQRLMQLLSRYPEVVELAASRYSPSDIATFLYSLAQEFNLFYQKHPVLKSEGSTRDLRLALTAAVGNVLKSGLNLLGIQTVDKM